MTARAGPNRSVPSRRRVRAKASEHPAGPVSLAALAGGVRLSKSHLARLFRNQVGLPPQGVSIAEAAQVAGFADQNHLTRHFKNRLGFTPGEYVRTLVRTETRRDPKTA